MRQLGIVVLTLTVVLAPMASALPTPGFFGEEARTVTGRLFPEAMETNDFVSYGEAVENLKLLVDENPDLLTYEEAGMSRGWDNIAGGHDRFPVPVVTVTNKGSSVPADDKINILFQLSIHANEKGGREGAVRVIEDFTRAWNDMDDTGAATPERLAMLDYMNLIFLFHNPDGWTHEEAEYRHNDGGSVGFAGVESQNFIRGNSNGTDLNRQAPTQGYSRGEGDHAALSEPSTRAVIPWLEERFPKIHFATDIHGMMYPANALVNSSKPIQCFPPSQAPQNPVSDAAGEVCMREGNFVLTMLPAAQMTTKEMQQTTHLAEVIKERLNSNDHFAEWNTLPATGVWGGEYDDWGTVWDTLGYVDTGFHSDWFAQDTGLDAPGVDFEYGYNHITFDNYYPGLAQRINDYHVETTRVIVGAFMDIAAQRFEVGLDSGNTTTAWVPTEHVATSADNGNLTRWAAENPFDDKWDWAHGGGYEASINDYFTHHEQALAAAGDGDALTRLVPAALAGDLTSERFDTLVIAGSAAERVIDDPEAISAVRTYVEEGGNLVLTDRALQLLGPLGVVEDGAVEERIAYAGYTNFEDREAPLAEGIRGLARQLYEPLPLGFSIESGAGPTDEPGTAPVWTVDRQAFEDAGGQTVGVYGARTNLGQAAVGDGTVTVIGALLPDPTEDHYHPYGLASYATTYTGNQIFRNAVGWDLAVDLEPRQTDDGLVLPKDEQDLEDASTADGGSQDDTSAVPFPGAAALILVGAALAVLQRRARRRDR